MEDRVAGQGAVLCRSATGTVDAVNQAGALLAGQARRFSLPAPAPVPTPDFRTADAALAGFKRFLDEPTGVRLLADTGTGLQVIDIDHDRISPADIRGLPAGIENVVLARPGEVVFQHPATDGSQSSFYLAPTRLLAAAVSIGSGQQAVGP